MNSAFIRVIVTVVVALQCGGAIARAQDSREPGGVRFRARRTEGALRVSAAALSTKRAPPCTAAAGRQVDPAGLGRGREQRRRPLAGCRTRSGSRFHSGVGPPKRWHPDSRQRTDRRFGELAFRNRFLPAQRCRACPHESRGALKLCRSICWRTGAVTAFPSSPRFPACGPTTRRARSSTAMQLRRMAMSWTLRTTRSSWRLGSCRVVYQRGRLAQWGPLNRHHWRHRGRVLFAGSPRLTRRRSPEGIGDAHDELRHVAGRYPYAPISNSTCLVARRTSRCKARDNIHQRNHLR